MLGYVVRWFNGIVRITESVPFHHISEEWAGAKLSDNLVDNVRVVILFLMFVNFPDLRGLFLAGMFILVYMVLVAVVP